LSRRPVVTEHKGATDEQEEVSNSEQSNVRMVTAEQENFSPLLSLNHEQNVDYMLSLMPEHDESGVQYYSAESEHRVQYYSAESEHPPEPPEPSPLRAVRVICQEGEMPST